VQLRTIGYQMRVRLRNMVPCFHKRHVENLALMVVGMVFAQSVSLPAIGRYMPLSAIQLEGRVERLERLLACPKLGALDLLEPVARRVLAWLAKRQERLVIVMDRSLIRNDFNFLYVAVAFGRRSLTLGWVRLEHTGTSDLAAQQRLLGWLARCLPEGAEVWIVADREFHSIELARWIDEDLGCRFALRIKAGTSVEIEGRWQQAGDLVRRGQRRVIEHVRVTKARRARAIRVSVLALWDQDEAEPWLLISNAASGEAIEAAYRERFWIEEMFSDHKSRGFNLERTRIEDPDRIERLLVALTLAYLWVMEIGMVVVGKGWDRRVDNRGACYTISLCQVGLRWATEMLLHGARVLYFTGRFQPLEDT
jgi:hypothetical protein